MDCHLVELDIFCCGRQTWPLVLEPYWSRSGTSSNDLLRHVDSQLAASKDEPDVRATINFLSGHSINVAGGFWGGVTGAYSPSAKAGSIGGGFVSPQGGINYSYSFRGHSTLPLRW